MRNLTGQLVWAGMVLCVATMASAALVIPAEKAALRTVGGPVPGGWNLWSTGSVTQALQMPAGQYQIIVRAWGSPARGVWPEMALLIDGQRNSSD